MIRQIVHLVMVASLVLSYSLQSYGQNPTPPPTEQTSRSSMGGPRRQLATILFAGLGGAILGLSTLSFYGRPQDRLSNIAIGAAVGVIIGTGYVTYRAASDPTILYGYDRRLDPTIDPMTEIDRASALANAQSRESDQREFPEFRLSFFTYDF